MARDEDPWKRFRNRQGAEKPNVSFTRAKAASDGMISSSTSVDLGEIIQQLEVMMDQLNNLYNQYFAGSEKRAPIEKRKQLNSLLQKLQDAPKTTLQARFRANTMLTRCQSQMERWDKLLRKLETGALRRRLGTG